MSNKRELSFWDMWNLSFGFFGVQIAYALQSANISRIFATLGADPHQLSFFWILPPLMGMIVQPLIGKYSDRTWCKMGRRKPYLLVGAIVAVLVMIFLPNAGSLSFSSRLILGLNGAMWFGLFSLIFLDTSINVAMQPFKMMVGDMVTEKQKAQAYSIQSLLCNAGSLVDRYRECRSEGPDSSVRDLELLLWSRDPDHLRDVHFPEGQGDGSEGIC